MQNGDRAVQEFFATRRYRGAVAPVLLLLHSPLLGPSSWERVADVARSRGISAAVPDLTDVARASPPMWRTYLGAAVRAAEDTDGPLVVAGHSGAGVFLPLVFDSLRDRVSGLVFVDSVVPPSEGAFRTSSQMRDLVASKNVDGVLLPWIEWWPSEIIERLLPDPRDREMLGRDVPRLATSLYEESVPMPDGWSNAPCGYLHLSSPYDEEREEAEHRGWPTVRFDGSHLSIVTEADRVLDAISELVELL